MWYDTHTPCAGKDTRKSGFYPIDLADKVLPAYSGEIDFAGIGAVPSAPSQEQGSSKKHLRINAHLKRIQDIQASARKFGIPEDHRERHSEEPDLWCSLVTLALERGDPRSRSPEAQGAIDSELKDLRKRGVWDEDAVKERDDYVGENPGAHLADLFPIVGIKGYDGPADDWIWKGRIVLGGHNIRDAKGNLVTLFQETASNPSNMCSARAAISHAALCKNGIVLQSDCSKAYTQSLYKGVPTGIRLPKKWWPPHWIGKYKDPICPLIYNLYGHPKAGNGWEKHFEAIVIAPQNGFSPVPNWPSVYYNAEIDVLIVVYVDDIVASGPEVEVRKALAKINEKVQMDPPEVLKKYLGCYHTFERSGNILSCKMEMQNYCKLACEEFAQESGRKLQFAATPYVTEPPCEKLDFLLANPGKYAESCAHHLMKLLYGARMARCEIIVAITRLARKIAKWTLDCDRRLEKLFDFLHSHIAIALCGSLSSDDRETVEIHAWPDADLGGNKLADSKSTSGRFIELVAPSSDGRSFPLHWATHSQGSTSNSTPEAETVSLSDCARADALPLQDLFALILNRPVKLVFHEDNTTTIGVVNKGYSPALRYLARTQRTAIGFLHEIFHVHNKSIVGEIVLQYGETSTHKGDHFTKEVDSVEKFRAACRRLGITGI